MEQNQQTLLLQDSYRHHFVIGKEEKTNTITTTTVVPFIKVDSTVGTITTSRDICNPISIDLEHAHSYSYLPGEVINGTVKIDSSSHKTRKRVDIHLACSFRVLSNDIQKLNKKQSIFKVMTNPIWIPENENKSKFSLTIPLDLPAYNNNDESIHGRIEYKIKAVYEIASDLPLSLYPKISLPILISAQISTTDPIYMIPAHNKKEISITIPRDVILRNKKLRKGEKGIVSAKLNMLNSCFLPGQSIPFSIEIQHIAPVKQTQGVQILLERITMIHQENQNSLETKVIEKLILPLYCDLDNYSACITDQVLTIPYNLSPTSYTQNQDIIMPFNIHYRLKVLVNMDMHHFLEDIPLRKRDRAYSMMTKIIGSLEQDGPAFFYGTTIELHLPITIGTTTMSTSTTTSATNPNRQSFNNNNNNHLIMVTSPDEYHSHSSQAYLHLNRLNSDPTFNRNNHYLIQQQQYYSSTCSFFSQKQEDQLIERSPSAPPFSDVINPPPYLE